MKTSAFFLQVFKYSFFFLFLNYGNDALSQDAIKIGYQTWAAANLNVVAFKNGDAIPEARSDKEWHQFETEKRAAWCYYNHDPANGAKYGRLYNWYAVNDSRGLAPNGWHVATDAEWTTLVNYCGGQDSAALCLKSNSGWKTTTKNGIRLTVSKFNALPGGSRTTEGKFQGIGEAAYWWTSSRTENGLAWLRYINATSNKVNRLDAECGLAVRLIKD